MGDTNIDSSASTINRKYVASPTSLEQPEESEGYLMLATATDSLKNLDTTKTGSSITTIEPVITKTSPKINNVIVPNDEQQKWLIHKISASMPRSPDNLTSSDIIELLLMLLGKNFDKLAVTTILTLILQYHKEQKILINCYDKRLNVNDPKYVKSLASIAELQKKTQVYFT